MGQTVEISQFVLVPIEVSYTLSSLDVADGSRLVKQPMLIYSTTSDVAHVEEDPEPPAYSQYEVAWTM